VNVVVRIDEAETEQKFACSTCGIDRYIVRDDLVLGIDQSIAGPSINCELGVFGGISGDA